MEAIYLLAINFAERNKKVEELLLLL